MKILKNKLLMLLVAVIALPTVYFLCLPSSGVTTGIFVATLLFILWIANEEAERSDQEEKYIDPEWIPGKEDHVKRVPAFLWAQ